MVLRSYFIVLAALATILPATSGTFAEEAQIRMPGPHPPSQQLKNPLELNRQNAASGRRIFYRMCVTCHGMDGKGNTEMVKSLKAKPSDFTVGKFKYGQSDGELFTLIQSGTPNGMTPYSNVLKERQIWQVIHYIRSLDPKKEVGNEALIEAEPILENPIPFSSASAARGKQFYARFCIKCHGANGKGDTEMREFLKTHPSNLADSDWTFGNRDGDLFKVIKEGTDNDMEAFADRLTDERIWHVVNYVRSLNTTAK
jgi:mono/diheme cytochrome c family protein